MQQGGIHRLRGGCQLVCRIQTDLGIETAKFLCAPVVQRVGMGSIIPKLHIPIQLGGAPHGILMSQLVALPGSELGTIVDDASSHRDEIEKAVDLLVSGF